MKTLIRVKIEHDSDTESPLGWSEWKLYSFSRKHANFRHPDEIKEQYGFGLQSKLRHNTAFILGYYEHGGCQWWISGEQQQCPWDGRNTAGILLWMGKPRDCGKDAETRKKHARNTLEEYTDWCNGNCYWWEVESVKVADDWDGDAEDDIAKNDWEEVDSCGGYIGYGAVKAAIHETIDPLLLAGGEFVGCVGDCKWMGDHHDFSTPLKKKEGSEA